MFSGGGRLGTWSADQGSPRKLRGLGHTKERPGVSLLEVGIGKQGRGVSGDKHLGRRQS